MSSNSQFTEMFLKWPLLKMLVKFWSVHEQGSGELGLLDYINKHKQNHKKSSLKLLVRFWNNLIEVFLEWPLSELFFKFWSVNKHSISEWRLLALYRHKEILVNSSLKATKKNWLEQSQKIRWAIQGHLGPIVFSESSSFFNIDFFDILYYLFYYWRYWLETRCMCSLSKEQSVLLRETIQNTSFFFFQNYALFLHFLSSIKHPTAECWHPHAVLLFFFM